MCRSWIRESGRDNDWLDAIGNDLGNVFNTLYHLRSFGLRYGAY
jgi:hypothetical protein